MKVFRYSFVFVSVVLFSACASTNSPQKNEWDEVDWNKYDNYHELTVEEVQADIAQVIEKAESTHPYVTMKDTLQSIKDNYKEAKEKLLAINTGMTTLELQVEIAEYLASFSDTHTNIFKMQTDNSLVIVTPFEYMLDTTIKKLVITDYPASGAKDNGTVITHIGGIAVDVLLDTFSKMRGQENAASISLITGVVDNNLSVRNDGPGLVTGYLSDGDLSKNAGCKIENNQIEYKFETGESKLLEVLTLAEYRIKYPADKTESATPEKIHSYKKNEDGSLYLRMLAMNDNDGSYDEFLAAVEAEVAKGVKNVVIDIRSNGGGNDWYPNTLLETLGFYLSDRGFYRRYSMATRDYRNTMETTGDEYSEPVFWSANKNDIELKILINEFTMSASMPLIAHVRYSGYGEIIGQASVQSPNFCGNAILFQLDNSGIIYYLPTSYSYYMDGNKKADNIIIPDIVVPFGEDALDYVEWD